jgi:hypothetical protein
VEWVHAAAMTIAAAPVQRTARMWGRFVSDGEMRSAANVRGIRAARK